MNRLVSDRTFQIIVLIVAIVLAVDIINVFVVGGPSVSTLVFKPANAIATSGDSSLSPENPGTVSPVNTASASAAPRSPAVNSTAARTAGSTSGTVQAIYVPTKATPIPTVRYITEVTPVDSGRDESTLRYIPLETPTPVPEDYMYIFSKNLSYPDAPTALAFNVTDPPLVIRYEVFPIIAHDTKFYINQTTSRKGQGELINTSYPSENSWFTITVYDRETGQEIDEDGYGETYARISDHTFIVHEAGSFLVQFDGANANVQVDMLLKRAGNSP